MKKNSLIPQKMGQLVWCPVDPSLGIGIVTQVEGTRISVQFSQLEEERMYTTRGAEQTIERYPIQNGETITLQNGEKTKAIEPVGAEDGLLIYKLANGKRLPENVLTPQVRDVGAKARLATLNLVHPDVVRSRIKGLSLATKWSRPGLSAVLGSRVQWLPHQIDVASRALEQEKVRLLLADEVGLGKTVEAALIYAGLRYEGRAERILILTPQSLAIQWLGEIYRKAHELLTFFDEERLDDARQDFPDLSPFESHQRILLSIDQLTEDPGLALEAAAADWDLVIVDEAHHLRWNSQEGGNPGYLLVEALSKQTRHMLLLTATPMALDPAEYHALLRLLDPTRFDAPDSFEKVRSRVQQLRTLGREVEQALTLQEGLAPETESLLQEVLSDDPEDSIQLEEFLAAKPGDPIRRRQANGVLEALRQRHGLADYVVRNRRGPVGGLPNRIPELFPLEPSDVQNQLIDVGEGVMLDLAATIDDPEERNTTLGRLLRALWGAPRALIDILKPLSPELVNHLVPYVQDVIGAPLDQEGLPTGDVRLRWLVKHLKAEAGNKVLIFVETDIAVRALKDSLSMIFGEHIAVFHRGLSPRDQDRQVAWFRDENGPQIMLSTEAGGEGRNFQFCHQVVLYDLPWRPAAVEQRIGRVDRVGQTQDVRILVPHFKSGYEAAILKIMQQSIGVLDQTVGGIDYALEFVSDRIAELILDAGGAEDWKNLFRETHQLISETRERIEAAVDPIIDHASFDPTRVRRLLDGVPEDIEEQTEEFVRGYAEHSHLDIHNKSGPVVVVEGAPSARGGVDKDVVYSGTFSRLHSLDHEELEFLSFGHPLVEDALEWSHNALDASAALALDRGYSRDGAVFVWCFGMEWSTDVPQIATYFDEHLLTLALDESGKRVPELESILVGHRSLDRMDPKPLKAAQAQWRRLVEQNHDQAEKKAEAWAKEATQKALTKLIQNSGQQERNLNRQLKRRLLGVESEQAQRQIQQEHDDLCALFAEDYVRTQKALENVRPKLHAAVAVRLVKAKSVSA